MGIVFDGHASQRRNARNEREAGYAVPTFVIVEMTVNPGPDLDAYRRTVGGVIVASGCCGVPQRSFAGYGLTAYVPALTVLEKATIGRLCIVDG